MNRIFRPSTAFAAAFAGLLCILVARPSVRAQGAGEHDYVGAEQCRSCHAEQYEIWAAGPHARSLQRLSARERKDVRCAQCHTMAPEIDDLSLTGIQCETCHGPGRWYAKEHVMRDRELREILHFAIPTENTCARCHTENAPTLQPFDYKTQLEKIRHWD